MKAKSKTRRKKNINQDKANSGVVNYTIGDFLIRIKNACLTRNKKVEAKNTKLIENLANTLKKEGLLDEVKVEGKKITASISYRDKKSLILDIKLVSKPGLRVYKGADELEKIKGPSIFIVSTNKGVMSTKEAIKKRVGGEVIAEIL
jgi:small subunit ribosomal protein S8